MPLGGFEEISHGVTRHPLTVTLQKRGLEFSLVCFLLRVKLFCSCENKNKAENVPSENTGYNCI